MILVDVENGTAIGVSCNKNGSVDIEMTDAEGNPVALAILRAELDAPPPEMAVATDEDRRKVEFSALVVLWAVALGAALVVGLVVWGICR